MVGSDGTCTVVLGNLSGPVLASHGTNDSDAGPELGSAWRPTKDSILTLPFFAIVRHSAREHHFSRVSDPSLLFLISKPLS